MSPEPRARAPHEARGPAAAPRNKAPRPGYEASAPAGNDAPAPGKGGAETGETPTPDA